MASAKSSRSRPAGHSGVFPVGGAALGVGGGGGGGGGGDGGVQLADKLKIFKTDNFDPDAYVQSKCQTMNEKVSQLSLIRLGAWGALDPSPFAFAESGSRMVGGTLRRCVCCRSL
jgi:hypothetical protein